jgi:hypothetical protein
MRFLLLHFTFPGSGGRERLAGNLSGRPGQLNPSPGLAPMGISPADVFTKCDKRKNSFFANIFTATHHMLHPKEKILISNFLSHRSLGGGWTGEFVVRVFAENLLISIGFEGLAD